MAVAAPQYEPDCITDTKVFVNGTRLPVGDIDLHIRNEGPVDIGYYVEGEFASPFNGRDYLDEFSTEENSDMDVLRVQVSPHDSEEYAEAFYGMVTGVGNAADGPERMWKFRARGPAFFLDKIPVGGNFEGSGAQTILTKVGNQLDDKLPIDIFVPKVSQLQSEGTGPDGETLEAEDNTSEVDILNFGTVGPVINTVEKAQDFLGGDDSNEKLTRTFTSNRHTLADVLNWFSTKTDTLVMFWPTGNQSILEPIFRQQMRTLDAHYLDGDIDVIANNALSEVNPINTLTVNGKASKTLGSLGDFEAQIPSREYAYAIAQHKQLYQQAGKTALHETTFTESGSNTKQEVKNEAKKLLYDRISQATDGNMVTRLHHPMLPHYGIRALPTCRGSAATDTDPITYNVSRVHHQIRTDEVSKTKLNVGIGVDDDDIVVTETGYKNA